MDRTDYQILNILQADSRCTLRHIGDQVGLTPPAVSERIRRMEEKSAELYGAGKIRGFLHLYIGEEACAVGALHALAGEDNVVATYREHGHALIRGMSMGAIMAEMFGIEFLLIDSKTEIPAFKNEINWNELAFGLRR